MQLRLILLLAMGIFFLSKNAQAEPTPVGRWLTEDGSGVIEIAPCGDGLCGRIVGQTELRNERGNPIVDTHGVPVCDLIILRGTKKDETGRWAGVITNPDDGANWRCEFWVGSNGSLRMRGYIMLEMLGKTQIWPPFHGNVARDCQMT